MSDEALYKEAGGKAPVGYGAPVPPAFMRPAIRHSLEVDKILPAMLKAQKAIEHAGRDATGHVGAGGSREYKYATITSTLDAIKKQYNDNDIVLVQGTQSEGATLTVESQLVHISGQWFGTDITMTGKDATPQTMGICETYGRRYGWYALTSLATEDDDGAGAQPKAKKSGTKKQDKKETDENEKKLEAEAEFDTAWDKVMQAIGEDDPDNHKALRQLFIKKTTEASKKFLVMADSLAGLSSNEIKLLTRIVTENEDETVGHCAKEWRTELSLPSLGVEVCAVCNAALSDAEKASCAIAKLPGYWCTKHVAEGVKKAQEAKSETV